MKMFPKNYINTMSETERLQTLACMYSEISNTIKDFSLILRNMCLYKVPELKNHAQMKIAFLDKLIYKYNCFLILYYTNVPCSIKIHPLVFGKGKYCINPKTPFTFENDNYSI